MVIMTSSFNKNLSYKSTKFKLSSNALHQNFNVTFAVDSALATSCLFSSELAGFQAFYLKQCHIPDRPPTLCDPLERPSGWSREAMTESGREEGNCVASMTRPSANLAIGRSTEKRNLRETLSTG